MQSVEVHGCNEDATVLEHRELSLLDPDAIVSSVTRPLSLEDSNPVSTSQHCVVLDTH